MEKEQNFDFSGFEQVWKRVTESVQPKNSGMGGRGQQRSGRQRPGQQQKNGCRCNGRRGGPRR